MVGYKFCYIDLCRSKTLWQRDIYQHASSATNSLCGVSFLLQFKIFIILFHFYGQYQSHSLQSEVQTEQIIHFNIFIHIMRLYTIRLAGAD